MELSGLRSESRELALARFRLIAPHLERERSLGVVAREAGVSLRTVQRWVTGYRSSGLAGLARKPREDRGGRRAVSQKIRKTIEGLALAKPPLPLTSIYRQVKRYAEATGDPAPSYWMVYDLVRSMPAALLTLAHEGTKAYSERFDLVHRREAKGSNAVWQCDHAELDIALLKEDGSSAKPWLTIVIDDYSRAIAGYYLDFVPPCSLRTCLALRQGIWRKAEPGWPVCGIPEVLYTDNGSDFTSRHLEQVAADLKMRLIFSLPGKPRGRGRIERFFRTLNEMLLCDLEGYGQRSGRRPSLTLPQLEERLRVFLLEIYHCRASAETGLAPVKRWEEHGFLPHMPESLEQLDLLLMHEVRARKVQPDGIRFQNMRYLSTTLAAYVGEPVTIRYDPRDLGEIRVFHQDQFLCRAISAELAGEVVTLREIVHARNRRRRELRTTLDDRRAAVNSLLEFKRGQVLEEVHADRPVRITPAPPALKRYRNE
jgi:putative transposase